MVRLLTGIVFLLVGAGVYHENTQNHERQIVFPGMNGDQTVAALLALGVLMVIVGGLGWLKRSGPTEEE